MCDVTAAMAVRNSRKSKPRGRPRGGVKRGHRVRDYPTLTVRVPPETRALLKALAFDFKLPVWQMLRHLVVCFVREMPIARRRAIRRRSKMAS